MIKKLFALSVLLGLLVFSSAPVVAQDNNGASTEQTASSDDASADVAFGMPLLKRYFIEGGWQFMGIVLVCLILGLAFCIERIISLSLADTNTRKLLEGVDEALKAKDVEKAKEICKATRGPVAGIIWQGLTRVREGIDVVEKSLSAYGSVQMGLLERGLVWIALFIALAPMLGFLGTVIGMVQAFDDIATAGAISASIVAGGIKVALLTTVFGLIVAIILQIFYNYIVSKIDGMVTSMEDASQTFIDMLVKYDVAKRS